MCISGLTFVAFFERTITFLKNVAYPFTKTCSHNLHGVVHSCVANLFFNEGVV